VIRISEIKYLIYESSSTSEQMYVSIVKTLSSKERGRSFDSGNKESRCLSLQNILIKCFDI
jgi:hypothetical protein